MRFLDFIDVPGFKLGPHFFRAQKVLITTKRVKLDTPTSNPTASTDGTISCLYIFLSQLIVLSLVAEEKVAVLSQVSAILSPEALAIAQVLGQGSSIVPSIETLRAHITEMEADLRNVDVCHRVAMTPHQPLVRRAQPQIA